MNSRHWSGVAWRGWYGMDLACRGSGYVWYQRDMQRKSLWNGLDIHSCGCRLLLVSYKLFLVIAYSEKMSNSLWCSAHLMCLYGARMLYETLLLCQPGALKEKMSRSDNALSPRTCETRSTPSRDIMLSFMWQDQNSERAKVPASSHAQERECGSGIFIQC